jgi:pimeloyl-ACP methyl ester carboxylesterase
MRRSVQYPLVLAHDRAGSGPPLLLVHGLGSCKEMWRPVTPLLARAHEVIALDLPGFGASPPGPRSVEGLADAVADFAASLGLERPAVAGNSMGGGIALVLGATGRARSACAVSPIGFANDREAVYARMLLAGTRLMAGALAPIAPRIARSVALRTATTSHAVARPRRLPPDEAAHWTRVYADAPAFWDLLRAVPGWEAPEPSCPTTIAWGSRDRLLIYSRQAPRARRRLPRARHITLTGCGHVPTWDDPEQVAAAILA